MFKSFYDLNIYICFFYYNLFNVLIINLFFNFFFNVRIVRPEKFQFLEKWQNRNFGYEIIISVKNP